jgi:hypothetical protein
MSGPKPPSIELSDTEREDLEALAGRPETEQALAARARIILLAADGLNNSEIMRAVPYVRDTVRHWRKRWLSMNGVPLAELSVADRLADTTRCRASIRLTREKMARIVALAHETSSESGRPISQLGATELAAEIVRRGIIDSISRGRAVRLLKRARSSRS